MRAMRCPIVTYCGHTSLPLTPFFSEDTLHFGDINMYLLDLFVRGQEMHKEKLTTRCLPVEDGTLL